MAIKFLEIPLIICDPKSSYLIFSEILYSVWQVGVFGIFCSNVELSENFLFNASESASALNFIKFSLSFKLSNLEILNSFKFFLSFNGYVSPEMALIVEFKACLNCSFIRSSLFIKPEYLSSTLAVLRQNIFDSILRLYSFLHHHIYLKKLL